MGISHSKSKEIQEYFRNNPKAKAKDVVELFGAKRSQVDYAKKQVLKGDPCSTQSTKTLKTKRRNSIKDFRLTDSPTSDCSPPPSDLFSRGPLGGTEKMFNGMLATRENAGMSVTGEAVVFSVADVRALLRNAAIETTSHKEEG